MENKYTIEEFKKMFTKAQIKTLKDLEEERIETQKKMGNEDDVLIQIIFTMQNSMVMAMLYRNLFEEGEEE